MLSKLRRWAIPMILFKSIGETGHLNIDFRSSGPALRIKFADSVAARGDESEDTEMKVSYGDSERVHIGEPPFFDDSNIPGDYVVPQPYVCVYRNARLFGPQFPLGLTLNGRPIPEAARNQKYGIVLQIREAGEAFGWGTTMLELLFPQQSTIEAEVNLHSVVPLTQPSTTMNYFHWVTETLPRLRGIKTYTTESGVSPKLLLNGNPPSWMKETLNLLGFPDERQIEWSYRKATVDRLIVPNCRKKITGGPFQPSRSDIMWVRNQLRNEATSNIDSPPERIFISRQDADRRRITNRSEVISVLHEYDFDTIVPTDHSVSEQVNLFRKADIIVGPHGAGLTNIIFADDATVVELFPQNISRHCYFLMCELLGLDYRVLIGTEANPNFRVDIDLLTSAIEELV